MHNSDGFDLVDTCNAVVRHCFVRSFDDSIIVKSFNSGSIHNILVADCVVWTDWGFSLGVTYETRTDTINDITFRECDILHNIACRGALGMNPNDRAALSNIRFEDIRVEDARSGLIEVVIERSRYAKDPEPGQIRDIYFKDIDVTGGPFPPSIVHGHSERHTVENVTFENITIHGKRIDGPDAGQFQVGEHAKNVRFIAEAEPAR